MTAIGIWARLCADLACVHDIRCVYHGYSWPHISEFQCSKCPLWFDSTNPGKWSEIPLAWANHLIDCWLYAGLEKRPCP